MMVSIMKIRHEDDSDDNHGDNTAATAPAVAATTAAEDGDRDAAHAVAGSAINPRANDLGKDATDFCP